MYGKSLTHYVAKIVVEVLLYVAIAAVVAIPFVVKGLFFWIGYSNPAYLTVFATVLFLSGLCCVYILYHLKVMYKTLLIGNPFVESNVIHLRKIALACCLTAVIYIVKSIILFTFASCVIAFVFMVGCLFCLTLKDLFKQAINYKNENELTI